MKKLLIVLFLSLSGMAAYSQSQPVEPSYDLKLTSTEVNFLLQLVAEQPYKNVAQLMMKLQGQLAPQIQEKPKGKPEGAGKPEGTPKGKPEGAGKPEGTPKNEE